MEYQVWTKDEYEGWKMVACEDLQAAQTELMKALLNGKDPLLMVTVPYDFNVKIKEDKIGEAPKGKAPPDKGTGVEGKGKVRPGAPTPVPELNQGSGDSGAGDSVPGK